MNAEVEVTHAGFQCLILDADAINALFAEIEKMLGMYIYYRAGWRKISGIIVLYAQRTGLQNLHVRPGDYIMISSNGAIFILTQEEVNNRFERTGLLTWRETK